MGQPPEPAAFHSHPICRPPMKTTEIRHPWWDQTNHVRLKIIGRIVQKFYSEYQSFPGPLRSPPASGNRKPILGRPSWEAEFSRKVRLFNKTPLVLVYILCFN